MKWERKSINRPPKNATAAAAQHKNKNCLKWHVKRIGKQRGLWRQQQRINRPNQKISIFFCSTNVLQSEIWEKEKRRKWKRMRDAKENNSFGLYFVLGAPFYNSTISFFCLFFAVVFCSFFVHFFFTLFLLLLLLLVFFVRLYRSFIVLRSGIIYTVSKVSIYKNHSMIYFRTTKRQRRRFQRLQWTERG